VEPCSGAEQVRRQVDSGHDGLAFGSPFKFEKKGKSGVEASEVFPKLGELVDDMAVIRSLWTDIPRTKSPSGS
jgi:hypothetical protein